MEASSPQSADPLWRPQDFSPSIHLYFGDRLLTLTEKHGFTLAPSFIF